MNRFFVILLGSLALYGFSFEASAYSFTVKVRNNTGHDLGNVTARWQAKGSRALIREACFTQHPIPAGGSYQNSCGTASAEKWQRQIQVSFSCPGQGLRTITFPRKAKFYKRDHATNNGDRYTVKLKGSDC